MFIPFILLLSVHVSVAADEQRSQESQFAYPQVYDHASEVIVVMC